jgi:hypothetical protein
MTVQATQALVDFVLQFVGNRDFALQVAQNPSGALAAQGVTEHDLSGVDMTQVVAEACQAPGFPPEAAEALQYYSGGGGGYSGGGGGYSQPAPHPQPVDHVVQQLQYVNYVTHEGDTTIQQTIIDQSTNFDVDGDFHNSGTIDIDNASASGAGAVAGGEGDVNAATGAGAQVIDDSIVGQNQNNSDGAVQVGGANAGPIVTGGDNDGIISSGPVAGNVVGDNNETANVNGPNNAPINFGDGAETVNVQGSTVANSNFGEGDNVSGNTLNDGSAIGSGAGNVTGGGNDTTTTTTTTTTNTDNSNENTNVNANDSIVNTEQGDGDQHTNNLNEDGFDFDRHDPPVLRSELAREEEEAPEEQPEEQIEEMA